MTLLNMGSCWNELMLNNAASERLGLLMDLVPIQLTSHSADSHNTLWSSFSICATVLLLSMSMLCRIMVTLPLPEYFIYHHYSFTSTELRWQYPKLCALTWHGHGGPGYDHPGVPLRGSAAARRREVGEVRGVSVRQGVAGAGLLLGELAHDVDAVGTEAEAGVHGYVLARTVPGADC